MNDDDDHERRRLAALDGHAILDTAPEQDFDDIVLLASHLCATPIALVSLVGKDRQWFKAKTGIEAAETPINQSVCAHGLRQDDLLVIDDLRHDSRTAGNSLVTGDPHLRFYAGAPLIDPASGTALGMLCVIDLEPRPGGLTDEQAKLLRALARQVVAQIALRSSLTSVGDLVGEQRRAHAASQATVERSRIAQEAGGIGTFEVDVATGRMDVSAEFCRIFGVPETHDAPASLFENLVIEEDRALRSSDRSRRDGSGAGDVEYRIRRPSDGDLRWIARSARIITDADGRPTRMFGVIVDVTDDKTARLRADALIQLGDRLRDAETITEVTAIATEIVGATLHPGRVGYAEIDGPSDHFHVEHCWTDGHSKDISGNHRLSAFPDTVGRLGRGSTVAVADLVSTPDVDPAIYAKMDVRTLIAAPVTARGRLTGTLFVHGSQPRRWSGEEIAFVQNVADRTHAALAQLQAEAEQQLLNEELSHRLKNSLAVVQGIANQTLKHVADRDAVEAFNSRLLSLSSAHDILLQDSWSSAPLRRIVEGSMALHAPLARFRIEGDDTALGPRGALVASMLLHELGTNAVKYGALSNDSGQVTVRWTIEQAEGEPAIFLLEWIEHGGPAITVPERKGFGSKLISLGLGTREALEHFHPSGYRAEFRAPLERLRQG